MPDKKVNYNTESPEFLAQVGRRIKALREATGIAQDKFAIQHDFDRSLFQKMEAGSGMTLTTLHRFLRAIDMSPAEFFGEGFE